MARPPHTQQGAAVVMALFIVVLCTLAVSPLIWNLFATAKTISVTAARDQAELVSRSGVDWARVILREDARVSTTDTLTEPWAVPLAESRINEGLMRKDENATTADQREVVLTGRIEDAQGRFNLRNLGLDNPARAEWLAGFVKLCDLLGVNPQDRERINSSVARMFKPDTPAGQDKPAADRQPPLPTAIRWEDFRGRYGISEDTWNQLRPYVVLLPRATPINANTTTPEVLYAVLEPLSYAQAQSVISQRDRVSFRNINDFKAALSPNIQVNNDLISVSTAFFLIDGSAQVEQALIRTRALLERRDQKVLVIWRQ